MSSGSAQALIRDIVSSLNSNMTIEGLNQTVDVYSRLYATIAGANAGGYAVADGANGTVQLLFGVPALYLGAWEQAYNSTHMVAESNALAYQSARARLSGGTGNLSGSVGFLLDRFNASWVGLASSDTVDDHGHRVEVATAAARDADSQLISQYMTQSGAFSSAVLNSFTLSEFVHGGGSVSDSELRAFAARYISGSSSLTESFVNESMGLGRFYDNASLYQLAGNIVWDPDNHGLDPGLSTLVSSFVSPSRDTTLISLGLEVSSDRNMLAVRDVTHKVFARVGSGSGVSSVLVTGQDAIGYDFGKATQADLDLILPVTIILLLVATGLFFRSFLTPFVTLGTIGVALGISQVFIVLVSSYIAKVDFTIPTVLLTILIGVGTDYSVFVIARFREERVKGVSVQEAVETSITWAGESITTSGATVIISFLALAITSIVFLRTMGLVVGLGVLVALMVALTLVPALLGILGGRTFWPNSGTRFLRYSSRALEKLETKRGYFSRSGAFSVKNAKLIIIMSVLVSVPALYVYSTTTPTYDFLSAAPGSLESISASNHLTSSFGGGRLFPTYVVLTFDDPIVVGRNFSQAEMAQIEGVSSYLSVHGDIRNVTGPTRPFGRAVDFGMNFSSVKNAGLFTSMLQGIGMDNKTALITINFGIDPYSTQAISDAQEIRSYLHSHFSAAPGSSTSPNALYVGGASGSILDTKTVFDSQFNSVVPLVAVGVALVLLAVLGSLFLPVFAVFSVLMSIVWTLGATKLIFQAYFDYQILFITPFFLFVTLLGLGMDYNVFILTRVREEAAKGGRLDDAIVRAIEQTGGIITAAAIILAGSLGALMLSSDLLLKQLGFAFAYSILIDALVVRTYLVPAVMSKMGKWNWYSPIPFLNRSHSLFEKGSDSSD